MKISVFFPGVGYHIDKPLLYYAKGLAASLGYEILEVRYGELPSKIKGSPEKMQQAFTLALENAMDVLRGVDWEKYDEILFVSKSIGTAVAAKAADQLGIKTRNIYYTPVAETFQFSVQPGVAFHGTADGWVKTEVLCDFCTDRNIPLFVTEGANHSMETENVLENIRILSGIMERTAEYMRGE